jgi:hypothetical protein
MSFSSLQFPIHPTTWTIVGFILLWEGAIHRQSFRFSLMALVFLWSCKEENLFLFFSYGLLLLLEKKSKQAWISLGLGGMTLIFQYHLRPLFLGETISYTAEVLKPWKEDWSNILIKRLVDLRFYREILLGLLPLGLAFFWQRNSSSNGLFRQKFIKLVILMLPLLGIRFLLGKWDNHYGIVLLALGTGCFYTFTWERVTLTRLSGFVGLCLLSIYSPWLNKELPKIYTYRGLDYCPGSGNRLQTLQNFVSQATNTPTIFASGNLAPHLVSLSGTSHLEVSQFCDYPSAFDVVYERGGHGDHWPVGLDGLERRIEECRKKRRSQAVKESSDFVWLRFD